MADAITVPQVQPVQPALRFLRVIPGIFLLAAVGYAGKLLEQNVGAYAKAHHWTFPNIEYVLWAILLGLLISNTVGVPEIFRSGVATYEFWLKAGIVLLGARFLLGDILKLGGVSLLLVAIEIIGSLALTTLLAVGSAVCGVSAIIATKGAIEADDEDSSFSIAAILALGALALFTFPVIGHFLHLSDRAYGLWAGLGVDNTAEATAAGALYSDAAGKLAVLVKSTRNAMIGFVVLAYAIYWAGKGQAQQVGNKAAFLWQKFPKFVLGFLSISAYLCGRRIANEFQRDAQAGASAVRGWRHWRIGDCGIYAGAGVWRKQNLRLVTGDCLLFALPLLHAFHGAENQMVGGLAGKAAFIVVVKGRRGDAECGHFFTLEHFGQCSSQFETRRSSGHSERMARDFTRIERVHVDVDIN